MILEIKGKYNPKIYIKDRIIYKLDCQCRDFIFRRIKKVGENSEARYFAEPCKHLKKQVEALIKCGYKLKKPKEMIGADKLTKPLRKKLFERAGNLCESPGCGSDHLLQVHRKTRGSNGGKYNMDNCIVLCKECHDARHSNEFPSKKSK